MTDGWNHPVTPREVDRAARFSYAQTVLYGVYGSANGGMFLIGYALLLGANPKQIGWLSTIPMLCIGVQLLTSALVEHGVNRRLLTFVPAMLNVVGWIGVILLPYVTPGASSAVRVNLLIASITLLTALAYIASNARSSWVGDLFPHKMLGRFFGRVNLYASIVGMASALIGGRFLDIVKSKGIGAFGWLFGIGIAFGLAYSILFLPQADVPLIREDSERRSWLEPIKRLYSHTKKSFVNRPLMMLICFGIVFSSSGIAGPFIITYMKRDLNMGFFAMGLMTAISTSGVLLSSSFWGRMTERFGSKPVIVLCVFTLVPLPLIWYWVEDQTMAFLLNGPATFIAGCCAAGVSVAINTLIYKLTPRDGRSTQFAVYGVLITLLVAPLPAIGGYLPDFLKLIGINSDIRATFYVCTPIYLAAALVARRLSEPESAPVGDLTRSLSPRRLVKSKAAREIDDGVAYISENKRSGK